MTRLECELKLIELMEQAMAILKEYAPDGDKLSMSNYGGHINVTALYKDTDIKNADFADFENTYSVYAAKYKDGDIWFDGGKVKIERESA